VVSTGDILFEPLEFRNLTVKNRLLRSNISGRFDNYDGSGTRARVNWEERFARGGVGAVISSYVPVHKRGRILPNYAMIDRDERIPFWRAVGEAVHRHDCRFILQLSHSGRQQDIGGVENRGLKALSSTSKSEPFHGFQCRAMTVAEIREVVDCFAAGARRARVHVGQRLAHVLGRGPGEDDAVRQLPRQSAHPRAEGGDVDGEVRPRRRRLQAEGSRRHDTGLR
jgi:2,4-dienoyl-CoA reductase (NADPH2)